MFSAIHSMNHILSPKDLAYKCIKAIPVKKPALTLLVAHKQAAVLTVDFKDLQLRGFYNPKENIFFLSIKDSLPYQNMTLALLLAYSLLESTALQKDPLRAKIFFNPFKAFAIQHYNIAVCAAYLALPYLDPHVPSFTSEQLALKAQLPLDFYLFRESLEEQSIIQGEKK